MLLLMKRSSIYFFCFLILTILGCRKPYNPPAITNTPSYLVVEGTIISGSDSTTIKLSRTVSLSNGTPPKPVSQATLTIESNASSTFPLTEIKPGSYASAGLHLDNTRQYRLRIITADNKIYLSDFVPLKVTPPIDSLNFTALNNGMQFYANTHDPNNSTRYYRWDYEETWQFQAEYLSSDLFDGTQFLPRQPDQQVYYCFGDDVSNMILLASSNNLSQDVIYNMPITFVPSNSEKFETKYSILLRQYTLTKDAYTFWANLKKNTERLGTIFDPLPSQINGNLHNINNPNEPVFGYISASTLQTKRIFIAQAQLPPRWHADYPYNCSVDTLFISLVIGPLSLGADKVALSPLYKNGLLEGYTVSSRECADCTLRGFTKQPSFWQ